MTETPVVPERNDKVVKVVLEVRIPLSLHVWCPGVARMKIGTLGVFIHEVCDDAMFFGLPGFARHAAEKMTDMSCV